MVSFSDDGYIDFEEYFNVMRTKMIKMDFEKERLKTAFKVLDTDQDGFITRDELKHALSKTGDRFSDEEIKDIIQKADKNLDGKIDYNGTLTASLFILLCTTVLTFHIFCYVTFFIKINMTPLIYHAKIRKSPVWVNYYIDLISKIIFFLVFFFQNLQKLTFVNLCSEML